MEGPLFVFDVDDTLYPHGTGLLEKIDENITAFIRKRLSLDADAAGEVRRGYHARYGTTLRGLVREHGLNPAEYNGFIYDFDLDAWIKPDPKLRRILEGVPGGRRVVLSNAHEAHVSRVLARLGVADLFDVVISVGSDGLGKPDPAAFGRITERTGVPLRGCACFDDDSTYLDAAGRLGMVTVGVGPRAGNARFSLDTIHGLPGILPALVAAMGQNRTAARP
jgi:putative hydrolase of the HAD superfamily